MILNNKLLILVLCVVLNACYGQIEVVPIRLNLVRDAPVNMALGPENAAYCRLLNSQMLTIFEDFGRCQLTIDKMDFTYGGLYSMYSGTTGSLDLDLAVYDIRMIDPETRATVTSTVEYDSSNAVITCSLPESGHTVRACTFRNPGGNDILITGPQTTTNTDVGNSVSSELLTSGCAITIHDIKNPGQGIWRCALRTDTDMFYGFQTVFLRTAIEDVSSINLTPAIRPSERILVTSMEEAPVSLSCRIDAPIRYCFFRDDYSGQVINVSPDLKSSSAEYIGNGFEAGDCGLKLSGLQSSRNLMWSCHIGVVGHEEEFTKTVDVFVYENISVQQTRGIDGNSLRVAGYGLLFERSEHCRFIRADGLSVSTDVYTNLYTTHLESNGCVLTTNAPSELDLQPWVVALKTVSNSFEISKRTTGFVEVEQSGASGFEIFVYVMLSAVLVALIVGIVFAAIRFRR